MMVSVFSLHSQNDNLTTTETSPPPEVIERAEQLKNEGRGYLCIYMINTLSFPSSYIFESLRFREKQICVVFSCIRKQISSHTNTYSVV